jgi:hypothetical protein
VSGERAVPADPIIWPDGVLVPSQIAANCTPFSRSGGRSLGGIQRTIRTDLGYWRISFKGVLLSTTGQRRMWNAIRTELGGVPGLVAIPVWSQDSNGSLGPAYTLHSDDTPHSDGAPYAQPRIVVEMVENVAIGATSAKLRIVSGIDELVGVRWSYNHALYETGLPTAIDGADWTVRLFPAIRAAIPAGAMLDFDLPTCLVHLATDDAMDTSFTAGSIDKLDVDFVEAVDRWADLAEVE